MAETTTTTNMSLVKPTATPDADARPGPDWAVDTNANWDRIDAHNHASGNGVKVPTAGIDIDADLDMNSNDLTELGAARFQPVAESTTTTHTTSLFVDSSNNELYWRTAAGVAVRVFNGNSLNITGVGGIGGDYSTTDSAVNYVDADTLYTFISDDTTTPDTWAGISAGDLRVYEKSNVSTYIELKSPVGLGSSQSLTLPSVPSTFRRIMTMSTAGVIETAYPSAVGAQETFMTLSTAGIPEVADSSTPYAGFKHGDIEKDLGGFSHSSAVVTPVGQFSYLSVEGLSWAQVPLAIGDRLQSISFYVDAYSGTGNLECNLYSKDGAGAVSLVDNTPGSSTGKKTLVLAAVTRAADVSYILEFESDAAHSVTISNITYTYDRP